MAFKRIVVTTDACSANCKMLVQPGAIGSVVSDDRGLVGVVFDSGQEAFVEPDGSGLLIRDVPRIYTTPVQ